MVDANRAFVQGLMSRGTLTFDEAKPMIAAIFNAEDPDAEEPYTLDSVTEEQFMAFINAASHSLAPFDYQVKHARHQTTRKRIFALINVADDAVTQFATTHSADDLSYIKRLLHAMFDTNNTKRLELMAVDHTDALNLRRPPPSQNNDEEDENSNGKIQRKADKGLTIEGADTLLKNLIGEGWLEKTPKRHYTPSPRGLMELRRWLLETFNDADAEPNEWQRIKMCVACKEIVTIGQRCADPDCNVRLHDICTNAYFRTRRGGTKCPTCDAPWSGDNFVGDRALGRDRAVRQSAGRRRSGGSAAAQINGDYRSSRSSQTAAAAAAARSQPSSPVNERVPEDEDEDESGE
ncbi:RING-like domain-containing protein [Zalerion maritima]|uniref:Non-structural maintenance of chromosomes element 1 homolog n=1 Tax=Zalerion maritima TaxID=339359 RepID=A0AAD5RK43_9PEZI|nr:RING-like domain-containing protein [Zalerion maritima]